MFVLVRPSCGDSFAGAWSSYAVWCCVVLQALEGQVEGEVRSRRDASHRSATSQLPHSNLTPLHAISVTPEVGSVEL